MELIKPVTGIAGAGLLAVGLLAGCGASDDQGGAGSATPAATDETGDGTVHAIELGYDSDTDSWLYSVKVLTAAFGEDHDDHKVLIDPVSGDVVDQESESTSDAEEAADLDDPMTYDAGLDKATAEVDGPLRGLKYEWDDGQLE